MQSRGCTVTSPHPVSRSPTCRATAACRAGRGVSLGPLGTQPAPPGTALGAHPTWHQGPAPAREQRPENIPEAQAAGHQEITYLVRTGCRFGAPGQ